MHFLYAIAGLLISIALLIAAYLKGKIDGFKKACDNMARAEGVNGFHSDSISDNESDLH